MTARSLAWRTIRTKPARAALAVVGVTVIGALLLDMLLDVLLDDEQAAASKATAARTIPAVYRFLCRRCMSGIPTIL